MGTYTVQRWKCDRCGAKYDERPDVEPLPFMHIGYEWHEGPGPSVHWKEFCKTCTDIVRAQIDRLMNTEETA